MDFALPELGEGVYEAELVRWLVKPGDAVKRGQSLLEVMTDKATMEVPAPFAGTISSIVGEVGQRLKVGDVVLGYAKAGDNGEAPPAAIVKRKDALPAIVAAAAPITANGHEGASAIAAPSVRHIARKLGIDLSRIKGSGPAAHSH